MTYWYGGQAKTGAQRQREFREKRAALNDEAFAALNREAALCLAVERAIQRGDLPAEIREGLTNGAVVDNLILHLSHVPTAPQKKRKPKTAPS